MTGTGKWADLAPRLMSGAVMAVGGALIVWAGGPWFAALAVAACGLMIWELAAMTDPRRPAESIGLGLVAAAALAVMFWQHSPYLLSILAIPALFGLARPDRPMRTEFVSYSLVIMIAAYGLVAFRDAYGLLWLLWLILVVVVTDVAGYFAGRTFGGPKFWPAVSPKKTWSGVVAGWIAAAVVGAGFLRISSAGTDLLWISALLSLASQLGDIAESAIKRRAGVKDSSHLIPGHGGLLDRFDGLLGAAIFMLVVAQVVDVPVVRF